jgi:lipopolysaccharide transport system permease protein
MSAGTVTTSTSPPSRLVIEPAGVLLLPDLVELWKARDLLWTLAGRDLKVRYKQTALGIIWIVLQPLLGAGILTFVFAKVAHVKAPGEIPYFLLAFAGMIVWTAFSSTLTRTSSALIGNAQLVSKVYFPRLILPLSNLLSTLVDVAVMFALLVIMCAWYRFVPPWTVVLLPLFVVLAMVLGSGLGTVSAGWAVSYRDVQYLIPVFVQMLLFASPVAYAASQVPVFRRAYFLNPMAGLIEGFRWALFGIGDVRLTTVLYATVASLLSAVLGYLEFGRMERSFADVI